MVWTKDVNGPKSGRDLRVVDPGPLPPGLIESDWDRDDNDQKSLRDEQAFDSGIVEGSVVE